MVDETQGMVETMTDKLTIDEAELLSNHPCSCRGRFGSLAGLPFDPNSRVKLLANQLADAMRENERLLEELNKCYEDFDDEFSAATSEKDRNYFKIRMAEINSFLNPNKESDNDT